MEETQPVSSDTTSTCTEDTYKQLYDVLNNYRFDRISFLELLEKWKAILRLPPYAEE